jgi:hypothetical protein
MKCLEKGPSERYPSAAALAQDLDRFLRGESVSARKMTPWGRAARLLRHHQLDVNWGALATLTLSLAPLPLVAHVAVFVLYHNRPEYPLAAVIVTLVTIGVMLYALFFGKASRRVLAPGERRRLRSSWLGNFIATILVPLTILRMMHPSSPEEWFVIYALWFIVGGCTYFANAANLGFLYVTAGVYFLLAVVAPFLPFYMPVVMGSLITFHMATLGLLLRRVARETASH